VTTPQQSNAADIKRDLQATLAARREIGPEYDEHFINALVEKMSAVQQAQQPRPQLPAKKSPPHDQQLALAICSLIFGIPIVAIAGGEEQLAGIIAACLLILGINVFFDRAR
jgi:hypothetical protein